MKKIGIITWFRDYNYGTKLQAYALQKYINEIGYDAFIINYAIPSNTSLNKEPKKSIYKKLYGRISWELLKITRIKYREELELRNIRLDEFTKNNCRLTKLINSTEEFIETCNSFDVIISGSDQIWNPDWYDPMYYADYPNVKSPKIAYAPSMGTNNIRVDRQEEIRRSLSRFKHIGMRENRGCELLRDIYGIKATKVVDPTFLLNKEHWDRFACEKKKTKKPFILCYLLSDNPYHWSAVKKFTTEKRMELRIIPKEGFSYVYSKKEDYATSIEDFITLIKNAEYVITDSFHACVFATIYNVNFIPIERFSSDDESSQNSRIYDFLNSINLMHILEKYDSKNITYRNINWDQVNSLIGEQIKHSKQYLGESLDL